MSRSWVVLLFLIVLSLPLPAQNTTPSPPEANAYIISPASGEIVNNPVTVRFGLQNMGIAPIGIAKPGTGHFHILLDEETLPPLDKPLHFGPHYLHYSEGQTETTLLLSPGEHTLQLMMADHRHIPHIPPVVSKKINIYVVD